MRSCFIPGLLLALTLSAQHAPDPVILQVNPFIGTGGHGHTFPGACVPNGLVQLSPDTRIDPVEWDGCGGYHYSDSVIYGFSHTHLSGTGVADLCDVLVMPMSGSVSLDPREYRSRFSHEEEAAHPGFYQVHLQDHDIAVELTATPHVGIHRYHFPEGEPAFLVLDLEHRDVLISSSIVRTSDTEVVGERRSSSWARDQRLYYCMRFSHPMETTPGQGGLADQIDSYSRSRDHFSFGDLGGEPLIVKVGISAVSIDGARANLEAEADGLGFDDVRIQAEGEWTKKLNKIGIDGGTLEQQRVFRTALYHCYIAPYVFSDVDGKYRGMDGEVHEADHPVYTVFSLWDTFRALHPLMTILEPEMTADWIRTFLLHHRQGGQLPVWELWGNETDCMIGYHSVSVIADAYMKGIRNYDVDLALDAMTASAMADDPGLEAYRQRGFISSEDHAESVSRTLEYAYDDACINLTRIRAGRDEDTASPAFRERSKAYESLFDPSSGFFRARRNGGFVPDHDPFEVNFHFTEANAWQYSLFVPQNITDLIQLHGGEPGLERFLDTLFTANSSTTGREQADITGMIGQYAHGNEPSHHMAYLYNRVGRPDKTRAMVKRIMDELYHDAPDGLSGNEDCGQMSAWYVLSAMGLYPVSPGIDERYDLGYPLFDTVTIALPEGRQWKMILADPLVPADTTYLSGQIPTDVLHRSIMSGGALAFDTERRPHRTYEPRQYVLDGAYIRQPNAARPGAPIIKAPSQSFRAALEVVVEGRGTCTRIDADGQNDCPMNTPFTISRTSTVVVDWSDVYLPVTGQFNHIDQDLSIELESEYANQYSAGGDKALIDGIRGGQDFRTGAWQGYQGQDVLATIDLGKVMTLDSIGLGILQDSRSWIWYPEYVDIAWSTNGRMWSSTMLVPNVSRQDEAQLSMDLWTGAIGKRAQYVKIMAKNAGPCPNWHLGAGGASWIFLDEVLISTR